MKKLWNDIVQTLLQRIFNIKHIQTLVIELFKIQCDLAPPIKGFMLNRRTICYNFRNLQEFWSERKGTIFYGLETVSYRVSQL